MRARKILVNIGEGLQVFRATFFLFVATVHCAVFPALAQAYTLPDTGQAECYNDTGQIPCPQPSQAYYGQDGNHRGVQPTYRDNGNGTVTDLVTGLMWQKSNDSQWRTWGDAASYCQNFAPDGQQGWRLPSRKELMSIVDAGRYNPAINPVFYVPTYPPYYWTDTTVAYNSNYVWFVYFGDGYSDSTADKSQTCLTRCVKGNSLPLPNIIDINSATVLDKTTGLIWEKEVSPAPLDWIDAMSWCEKRNTDGKSDWRLPNKREIESLADETRYLPAIDPLFSASMTGRDPFWSSSTSAGSPVYAWYVSFGSGHAYGECGLCGGGKPGPKSVRCVRGGYGTFDIKPGLSFSIIGNQQAGTPFPVTVTALKSDGSVDTSVGGNVLLTSPGIVSPTSLPISNGQASFNASIQSASASTAIHAQIGGLTGDSNSFSVSGSVASGSAGGHVFDSNNVPVSGVSVVATLKGSGTGYNTTTDSQGFYLFPVLPAGEYDFSYSKSSYWQYDKNSMFIAPGSVVDFDIHVQQIRDSTAHPVIFIPGIMGSTKSHGNKKVCYPDMPDQKTSGTVMANNGDLKLFNPLDIVGWDALKSSLEASGIPVQEYHYDWRLHPNDPRLMSEFGTFIRNVINETNATQVDIVAHSMGGLLARAYIQSDRFDPNNPLIRRFAMVGTPNHGSLDDYFIHEGGDPILGDKIDGESIPCPDFTTHTSDLVYETMNGSKLLKPNKLDYLVTIQQRMDFFNNIKSAAALAYTGNFCLYNDVAQTEKSISGDYENKWLKQLNSDSSLSRIQNSSGVVKTMIFASNSENTLSQLTVRSNIPYANYYDGKPVQNQTNYASGDGTVLTSSSMLGGVNSTSAPRGAHRSLIKSFASEIVSFLTAADAKSQGNAPLAGPVNRQQADAPVKTLGISVDGRISAMVTDPQGRRNGTDPAHQAVYRENSSVSQSSDSSGFGLDITGPPDGTYTVTLTGGIPNIIPLQLSYYDGTNAEEKRLRLYYPGGTKSFQFTFNSAAPTRITPHHAADLNLSTNAISGATKLSWRAISGASQYKIYSRRTDTPFYSLLATVSDSTSYQTGHPLGSPLRQYAVTSVDAQGNESFASEIMENRDYPRVPIPVSPGVLQLLNQ